MIKDIKARRGARRVREMVAEGEHERQDFKYAVSDARKIARSISAFANRYGGRLLIGVKDNGEIAGVRSEEDIYLVELAAGTYCRPAVQVEFEAWSVDTGVTVIEARIPRAESEPVSVDEGGGKSVIYCRIADSNIVAPDLFCRSRHLRAGDSAASLPAFTPEIVRFYAQSKPAEVRALALEFHIPEQTAASAVVNLLALDILHMGWNRNGFTLNSGSGDGENDNTEGINDIRDADTLKKFGELKEI